MSRSSVAAIAISIMVLIFAFWSSYQLNVALETMGREISELSAQLSVIEETPSIAETTVLKTITVTETSTIREEESGELSVSDIYGMVKDSVVSINVVTPFGRGIGSGFVYDAEGHIVTNNHVVEDGVRITVVFLNGTSLPAEIVGLDPDSDLAVLKVDPNGVALKPLKLGDSTSLRVGERIMAVGSPFGLQGTVTAGIVSQKGRLLETVRGYGIPGIIQIDAAINPGNSGGPLLNMKGEVVGVTTAIESRTGGFVGIGYAIPSSIVSKVVPELIKSGAYRHSWLGISGKNMNPAIAEAMNIDVTSGFLVEFVVEDSPADKAGIRGGDRSVTIEGVDVMIGGDIIIGIDGQPVRIIDDLLSYLIENTRPGDTVKLTIIRQGSVINIDVVLGARPPS